MTTVDLVRIARSIVPPVGATMAIACVDINLKHRAAFLIDGRIHGAPVGPAFDRPRDAIALVNLLNGEAPNGLPARHPSRDLARVGISTESRDEVVVPSEASGGASTSACAGCGGPLPPGSYANRHTCSDRCRRAVARRAVAEATRADQDGGAADVTPSRASEAAVGGRLDPSPRAAAGVHAPLASARGDRSEPVSEGTMGAPLSLGL